MKQESLPITKPYPEVVAGLVLDDQVVVLVIFNVELEHQIHAFGGIGIEVLLEFLEYLGYGHHFSLCYKVL